VCLGNPSRADDIGSVEGLPIPSLSVFELIKVVVEFDFVNRVDEFRI